MTGICPRHECEKVTVGDRTACPACRKESARRYRQSEKGKRTRSRWWAGEMGRAVAERQSRYQKTEKSKGVTLSRRDRNKANGTCAKEGCRGRAAVGKAHCQGCIDEASAKRAEHKANGLCGAGGCVERTVEGKALCQGCLGKRTVRRAGDRVVALQAVSPADPPSCAVCGTTATLEIDHIHNDGHLDTTSGGNRHKTTERVLGDITAGRNPREWAQVLCRHHNLEKAKDAKARHDPEGPPGLRPRHIGALVS